MAMRTIAPGHPEWRKGLGELGPAAPPKRLFVRGRAIDPEAPTIAVVGARYPTLTGLEITRRITTALAEAGLTVVSGLARGIDAAAHESALEADGHTIAVLGCGLDVRYPASNAKLQQRIEAEGTLVSEYPLGAPPHQYHFPERNRIIAGLADGVLIVEGTLKSGSLITARIALDCNRHVFAVPGSIRNPLAEGPNEYIRRQQAGLVTCAEHIFEELAPGLAWTRAEEYGAGQAAADLEDADVRVLRLLEDAPTSPDTICSELDAAAGMVALALARLEIRGFVRKTRAGFVLTEAGSRTRKGRATVRTAP